MAFNDNSYSRMVAWLKVILLLGALAILSTLFLVSQPKTPGTSLPYAKGQIDEIAREQKIGNLSYSGVLGNGALITLNAKSAKPVTGEEPGLSATMLEARIDTPDGQRIRITASTGMFDTDRQLARLENGVSITTTSGYYMQTQAVLAEIGAVRLSTTGPVTASGPLGQITAGAMVLQQKTSSDQTETYELLFKGGIKLIYVPQP